MNLHISSSSVFIDAFYQNLVKLDLAKKNKIVLRSDQAHSIFPSARMDSQEFRRITGDPKQYDKVFIHQFSPLMYRWVAQNDFKQLNWMIWGADLYNLPDLENEFYEPLTRAYVKSDWSTQDILYKIKLALTAQRFKNKAYAKVDHILTWMKGEYAFAKKMLPLPKADHQFFFYENPAPFKEIKGVNADIKKELPVYILGNSGVKTNNHLDALDFLSKHSIHAKLILPVSYGDKRYVSYLKKHARAYSVGPIEFMENFMSFEDYSKLLQSADGLIMNTIRPQGYGNIFTMMCMGKPVYINPKNVSLGDLTANGIQWNSLQDLLNPITQQPRASASAVINLLSHEKMVTAYTKLFS